MPDFRTLIRNALALAVVVLACSPTHAQTYPDGQVRIIVPTSPGGVTDTMARIVAQRLSESLGQTVIVDNRPGGNGSIGAVAVAHAPPDGLTLLVTSDATITANPLKILKISSLCDAFLSTFAGVA